MKQCDKVKYATKAFAEADIKKLKSNSIRDKIPIRAYLCYRCDAWHLTSQDSKEMRVISNLEEQNRNLKAKVERLEKEVRRLGIKLQEKTERLVEANQKIEIYKKQQWIQIKLPSPSG